jgi:hypothetical protein
MKPMTLLLSPLIAVVLALEGAPAQGAVDADSRAGYDDAYRKAVREDRPLLIFVGQPAREVPGCVSVHVEHYSRAHSPGVVIGMTDDDGDLARVADLEGNPSDKEILAKADRPARRPAQTRKSYYEPPAYQYAPPTFVGGGFGGGFGGGSRCSS